MLLLWAIMIIYIKFSLHVWEKSRKKSNFTTQKNQKAIFSCVWQILSNWTSILHREKNLTLSHWTRVQQLIEKKMDREWLKKHYCEIFRVIITENCFNNNKHYSRKAAWRVCNLSRVLKTTSHEQRPVTQNPTNSYFLLSGRRGSCHVNQLCQ